MRLPGYSPRNRIRHDPHRSRGGSQIAASSWGLLRRGSPLGNDHQRIHVTPTKNSAPGDSGIIGRNIERFSSRDSLGVQWARVT